MAKKVTISKIRPFMKGVSLDVKIVKVLGTKEVFSRKTGRTHKVMEALAEDETGKVGISVWDDKIIDLEEGEKYEISNAYVSRFRGKNVVNVGKYGDIKKIGSEEKKEEKEA